MGKPKKPSPVAGKPQSETCRNCSIALAAARIAHTGTAQRQPIDHMGLCDVLAPGTRNRNATNSAYGPIKRTHVEPLDEDYFPNVVKYMVKLRLGRKAKVATPEKEQGLVEEVEGDVMTLALDLLHEILHTTHFPEAHALLADAPTGVRPSEEQVDAAWERVEDAQRRAGEGAIPTNQWGGADAAAGPGAEGVEEEGDAHMSEGRQSSE